MKLSPGRRRGLEVLARVHPNPCRRSNDTSLAVGYVYWQTVDWLEERGFVTVVAPTTFAETRLTDAGLELARAEGLLP